MKKYRFLYFSVIHFAFLILYPQPVQAQSCPITEIKEIDLSVQDERQKKSIMDLIGSHHDFEGVPVFHIIQVDINNDGQDEYIAVQYGGSGHYLSWTAFTRDGYKVPDIFWGTDIIAKQSLMDSGNLPQDHFFVAKICNKNYLGFRTQSDGLSLYYIEKNVAKACTPAFQRYFKTRSAQEQWSSFCQKSFTTIDPTKKRDDLVGYFSVNDACFKTKGEPDRLLLDPGVSEIIITPSESQDLNVTVIRGGFWSSSKEPEISTYSTRAVYEPNRGYRFAQPVSYYGDYVNGPRGVHIVGHISTNSQVVYLVPEKDRLVLEVLNAGELNNYSWTYDQRKKIPKKCNVSLDKK